MNEMRYERPTSIAEACDLLISEPHAAVLAGGTDLVVAMRSGHRIDCIVDIKGISELNSLELSRDNEMMIGACVILQRVADNPTIKKHYPGLAKAAGMVGSYQVRNRATLGGNLCNASPCADTAPPLLVLGARITIVSSENKRDLALHDFFKDVKQTVIQPGEIVKSIIIPSSSLSLRTAFYKIQRIRGHDLALLSVAGAYSPEQGEFRIAVGSAAPIPILTPPIQDIDPASNIDTVGNRLAEKALPFINPIDDVRASAKYRREMTIVLCKRLAKTLLNTEEGGYHAA